MEAARWLRKHTYMEHVRGQWLEKTVSSFQKERTSRARHASQATAPRMVGDTNMGIEVLLESQAHEIGCHSMRASHLVCSTLDRRLRVYQEGVDTVVLPRANNTAGMKLFLKFDFTPPPSSAFTRHLSLLCSKPPGFWHVPTGWLLAFGELLRKTVF